ncbi:MAG TPA: hypothetical protein VFN94_08400 [Nitrospiria bacterium]|nr:hypothetical protein [Nitrospiria bacterium]
MSWRRRVAVVLLVALSACAGAPKLTDDGRRVQRVDAFLGELDHAYERRDATAVMAALSPRFADRDALGRQIDSTFAEFNDIELAFAIERIQLDPETATVYLRWDGEWRAAGRAPVVRQGAARFVVETGEHTALAAVLGDTPFGPVSAGSPIPR